MIIILTYGKVASQSLKAMAEREFPGEVYYSHGLQTPIVSLVDDFARHARTDSSGLCAAFQDNGAIQEGLKRALQTGDDVIIISGVRDPIARSLSATIQNLDVMFDDCVGDDPSLTAENLAARIESLWLFNVPDDDPIARMCQATICAPLYWLSEELEKPFGFDILSHPFDVNRGYALIRNENISLLLYRQESAPHAIEVGLEELFPGRRFTLPQKNQAKDKSTVKTYETLKAIFRLPRDKLISIYASPYVRHFFSEEEISSLVTRWQSLTTPKPSTMEPTSKRRATVVIAALNHSEWIGAQLESLFAQWRPDLDLLVIDDGSTDGTLNIIRQLLASRPDIPATFLRNEQAIGLGVIPQILRHTKNDIIIQADSDDIALPGRIDAILACFGADLRCRLVTSNALKISSEGFPIGLYDTHHSDAILEDPLLPASERGSPRWLGATSAMHRSLLEEFPPLDTQVCPYGLDLLLAFRATLVGTHHYLARPLIGWRQHSRNSHRLVGSIAMEGERREFFASIELMVLAQKIRDAEFVRERYSKPQAFEAVLARCHALFFERFAEWSRIRIGSINPLAPTVTAGNAQIGPAFVAPIPAIVTLERGIRQGFGNQESLGAAASTWNGFYPAEPNAIWTAHVALIVFRISDPELKSVTVRLNGLPFLDSQRIRLSAAGSLSQEFKVMRNEGLEATLLVQSTTLISGYLTLMIEALDARTPQQAGYNNDNRLLGASLEWIEAS